MKARVPTLQVQPLTPKTKGNRVSEEETNTLKGISINAISVVGEPIDPPQISAKFQNAIGAIIRTKIVLDPTIPCWPLVLAGKKVAMWQLLKGTFILPRGTKDQVERYALKVLGETFLPVEERTEYTVCPEGSNAICRLWGHHTSTMGRVCLIEDH